MPNIRVSEEVDQALKRLKAETGVNKNFVADNAIRAWLQDNAPKLGIKRQNGGKGKR